MAKKVSVKKKTTSRPPPKAARPTHTTLRGQCGKCAHAMAVNLGNVEWAEYMRLFVFCKDCQLMFELTPGVS